METPHLIQRLRVSTPAKRKHGLSFEKLAANDEMDSPLFSPMALETSLKMICRDYFSYTLAKISLKSFDKKWCYVFVPKEYVMEYQVHCRDMANNKIKLDQISRFDQAFFGKNWDGSKLRKFQRGINGWWDIENHVIFGFGKLRLHSIILAIANTMSEKIKSGLTDWSPQRGYTVDGSLRSGKDDPGKIHKP